VHVSARRRSGPREVHDELLTDARLVTYVQLARGLHYDQGALRLEDLAPSTIWVRRGGTTTVGQVSTGAFLDLWWDSPDGPSAHAPRARLTLLDPDAHLLGDPNLRLSGPRITGSGITYDVESVSGVIPSGSGACVLFINPPDDDPRAAAGRA
jgi:hypothetical protein